MHEAPPLSTGNYIALATFRRDGREVRTPVWFVEIGGLLHAYTLGDSGKVKRLRRNPRVRVAPCTYRGEPIGPWREGTAGLVDDAGKVRQVYEALAKKYGWLYRLITALSRLSGSYRKRVVLAIALD